MAKVILWDFHGTLAVNDWMFSKALYKVLCDCEPDTQLCIEDFKKQPMYGFPWQNHEKEYLHLTNSDSWWKNTEGIFVEVYKAFGINEEKAVYLASRVKAKLVESHDYILYDDTIEMLSYYRERGFSNIILSNHIPELEEIVESLGLSKYISLCISSARVGYEKPHPEIYKYALRQLQSPEEIWMVGDSKAADVKGPEAAGIKGILVRSKADNTIRFHAEDLRGLKNIID